MGAPSMPTPATNPVQGGVGLQIPTTTNGNPINPTIQQSNNPISDVSGVPSTTTNARFLFVSSAQSWVGQGQSLFAATTNGYNVTLFQISPNILQFNVSPTDSVATNWFLEFSCTNDMFTVGTYSNAVNAGGSPARFVFGGMGRGDNTSDGAFKVLEVTYSSNQIVSFAADFVQYDNDDTNAWNEGSIRYNSAVPDTVNMLMAPLAIAFQNKNTVLAWSTNLVGFQLEYATNAPPGTWFTNDSQPVIVDGQYTVTVTNATSAGLHLYRLMKPLTVRIFHRYVSA
ncbi:MAG TPA: hypothetical protein VMF08_00245 [Candidatus Sulfotelmatobacter sp.]|nr:hypothetical protein [Candidatus Sulfotelmatobacter sp.]